MSHQISRVVPEKRKRRLWRRFGVIFALLVLILVAVRLVLPWLVHSYVNRILHRSLIYKGEIGQVQLNLWRGAYTIHDVRFSKRISASPVPFFKAKEVDFSIQWPALLHESLVGRFRLKQPQINFVSMPEKGETQTGAGGSWLQMIQNLFPFKINQAVIQNGSIHYRVFQPAHPVDVYLSDIHLTIDNLSNIRNSMSPLAATVQASALAMNQAKLNLKMTFDPVSYRPTFHLDLRLLGLDVTTINDLALTYGKFDFQKGWLDFVLEADAKNGLLTGYAKPLFRDLQVFSLTKDFHSNPLQYFWQALIGAVTDVFKNQSRNQFGTLIPFSGDLSSATTADMLATIGNLLRNAFVRAYLPRLQPNGERNPFLQFSPPKLSAAADDSF